MLQIVDYSEKAIAVIGTEKGNQEQIYRPQEHEGQVQSIFAMWQRLGVQQGEERRASNGMGSHVERSAPRIRTADPCNQATTRTATDTAAYSWADTASGCTTRTADHCTRTRNYLYPHH